MEKGKCCELFYQQARQVTEQGEPGRPREATPAPPLQGTVPLLVAWRGSAHPSEAAESDFSQDGGNARFLICQYQKVSVLETARVTLSGQKSGGGFPWRGGDDRAGRIAGFCPALAGLCGFVWRVNISGSHTFSVLCRSSQIKTKKRIKGN